MTYNDPFWHRGVSADVDKIKIDHIMLMQNTEINAEKGETELCVKDE